jgi:glutamate synthase domain-containing protein 2/rubredoxin
MSRFACEVCGYIYDEERNEQAWQELPAEWKCPVCGTAKELYHPVEAAARGPGAPGAAVHPPAPGAAAVGGAPGTALLSEHLGEWRRFSDEVEEHMAAIHAMAETGRSVIEPMRARKSVVSWDELLFLGAQLARFPLDKEAPVDTRTTIGPKAAEPLELRTPVYVTHMSFGALSREVKLALARGSAAVGTAMCSGEGGILAESLEAAYRYIFEYVPNRYSVTEENLKRVDAVEIKVGQSSKPGLGGHLPGEKVTDEIAAIRGFPPGQDIVSPSRFADIREPGDLTRLVDELRERTGGKPVGVKLAAGHVEQDLEFALEAGPDFITIDGRPGGTGASPKFVKDATSVPTIYALVRARRYLDAAGADGVSLVITGGLRVSSDFAKALALGADAVAVGTAALMACCCQQYRMCNTGQCPVGCATQDPELRARVDVARSAQRVENYLSVCTAELEEFARLTGRNRLADLDRSDLCTVSAELARALGVEHAAGGL